jgi:hypothetical protein
MSEIWIDELPDSVRREYEKRRRELEGPLGETSRDAAPEQEPVHLGLLGSGYWVIWRANPYRLDWSAASG